MSRSPTFIEALGRMFDARIEGVNLSMPARVERYDATKQQIDAQPLIKQAYLDEAGDRQIARLPVIVNVPVIFPGSGSWRVTFPIAKGDTVDLIFSAASLDVWLAKGGEVDPLDDSRFAIKDAIAIPGLRDFAHPLSEPPDDAIALGYEGGSEVRIEQAAVRLNTATGQLVALANLVTTELSALRTAHNAHVHAETGVTTAVPTVQLGAAGSVAADGVYAKE
jgi:hypothetical protein